MSALTLRRPALVLLSGFGLKTAVARMLETRRTRKALAKLDTHLLQDIGIDQITARREALRPF